MNNLMKNKCVNILQKEKEMQKTEFVDHYIN